MTTYSEKVRARDGKLEDKLVFGFSALTLLIAAILLYSLYGHPQADFTAVPKPIRAALTSLSNAGEEIQMVRAIEGRIPSVDELSELGIQPFSSTHLESLIQFHWAQVTTCYVGQTQIKTHRYFIKLELPNGAGEPKSPLWYYDEQNNLSNIDLKTLCFDTTIHWHSAATINKIYENKHDH
ncbi:hypothetical protein A3715_11605 [Oleiphilus sp. HI0009]|uniref:hypothetical protein n=1 Tax=Oleiphilus sp. HI0125 TaxID=1822266 RepID=UPI0007C2114A|nr:hypothetical protein [Oleiphilus sp. HI0125]KZX75624.1 hypothetical protein A3715_22690 [Oleiphilus sp. HI0009]KZX77117.1 hypothetical protein A3715_11605 [Oleiphilus sp. HI0009]KZZ59973.1 hypothetical protein A3762_03765 [Oleiphilus sp. HI0125]